MRAGARWVTPSNGPRSRPFAPPSIGPYRAPPTQLIARWTGSSTRPPSAPQGRSPKHLADRFADANSGRAVGHRHAWFHAMSGDGLDGELRSRMLGPFTATIHPDDIPPEQVGDHVRAGKRQPPGRERSSTRSVSALRLPRPHSSEACHAPLPIVCRNVAGEFVGARRQCRVSHQNAICSRYPGEGIPCCVGERRRCG